MFISLLIILLGLLWLGKETDWLRINLAYAMPHPKIKPAFENIVCYGCRKKALCHRKAHDDEFLAWELPAKTIQAFGFTFNFNKGCNILRASMLRDAYKLQTAKPPTPDKNTFRWDRTSWEDYERFYEPTIEISVDNGETITLNGNYKPGAIKEFMAGYTHKMRVGKRVENVMDNAQVMNCGGGVFIVKYPEKEGQPVV